MTTIVYDGKAICVDSQSTCGDRITSVECKKAFFDVGEFLAVFCCGHTSAYPYIIEWLRSGCEPLGWDQSWQCAAWCVRKDGSVVRYVSGYPEEVTGPDADGSGGDIAMGALLAGADAEEALEIAKELDIYTGGESVVFRIPEEVPELFRGEAA